MSDKNISFKEKVRRVFRTVFGDGLVIHFYLYGLMRSGEIFVGEWLYQTYGFSHHGYPIFLEFQWGNLSDGIIQIDHLRAR